MANTAPSGTDKTVTVNEDTPYAFADADFGFSDAEHQLLGVIITGVPGNGTLKLNGVDVQPGDLVNVLDLPNVVWTPALNANGDGLTTLTFKVVDDGGTADGGEDTDATENTITFNVTPVNDPAVFPAQSWTLYVREDEVLEATISFTLVDPDGTTDFTVTTAQYGTVTTTWSGTTGTVTYHLNNSLREVQLRNSPSPALIDGFKIIAGDGTERPVVVRIEGVPGETILGDVGDNTLVGTMDGETIQGLAGADTFTGDLERDTLHGGLGDDLFELGAHTPALLHEESGGGIDTVTTTISRTLDFNTFSFSEVENLILLGSGSISGTGNNLANTIDGSQNSAANVLKGLFGDDTYIVGAGDTVVEASDSGTDMVRSYADFTLSDHVEYLVLLGSAGISGTGNNGANFLSARLNSAANTLTGLGGDDVYYLDANDVAIEEAGGGKDTIVSSLDYTLGAHFENLELSGTAAVNGTGNALDNRLNGRSSSVANHFVGLAGNDVYLLGEGDTVEEVSGEGEDWVVAGFDYELGDNVENLELSGTAAISGAGNDLANDLDGRFNSAANVLTGRGGNDVYWLSAGDSVVETNGGGTEDWVVAEFSYTLNENVENLQLRGNGDSSGTGNELANDLDGRFSRGENRLIGRGGDDVYFVGEGDIVVEAKNGGTDWIVTEISFALAANVERLELRGDDPIWGIGNDSANRLDGRFNSNANVLQGLDGDDIYLLGAGDRIYEEVSGGVDLAVVDFSYALDFDTENLELAGTHAITGTGNQFANRLDGRWNSAANLLKGLWGNDVYLLGAGDRVQELANGGTDLVVASFNYTLGSNVEKLELSGTKAISGTGNGLDNWLDGRFSSGANLLRGLGGDDVYFLGKGDRLVETANGGRDWVVVLSSYMLPAYVEHLELNSTVNQNGTGNTLNNDIIGNEKINILDGKSGNDRLWGWEGNDILIGGVGDDMLTGGKGNDIFRYLSTGDSNGRTVDVIYDFDGRNMGDDKIDVSRLFGATMSYIHNKTFTKAGQVRIVDIAGSDLLVEINTTGSLAADFALILKSTVLRNMSAGDFVL